MKKWNSMDEHLGQTDILIDVDREHTLWSCALVATTTQGGIGILVGAVAAETAEQAEELARMALAEEGQSVKEGARAGFVHTEVHEEVLVAVLQSRGYVVVNQISLQEMIDSEVLLRSVDPGDD